MERLDSNRGGLSPLAIAAQHRIKYFAIDVEYLGLRGAGLEIERFFGLFGRLGWLPRFRFRTHGCDGRVYKIKKFLVMH